MAKFTDATGQDWAVDITVGTVARIRSALDVNFADLGSGTVPPLFRFRSDIMFQVDVLYVVCREQADKAGVSDIAFAEVLGDTLEQAAEAFEVALEDFFQRSKMFAAIKVLKKQRAMIGRGMDLWGSKVESVDVEQWVAEMEREADKILNPTGNSAGKLEGV